MRARKSIGVLLIITLILCVSTLTVFADTNTTYAASVPPLEKMKADKNIRIITSTDSDTVFTASGNVTDKDEFIKLANNYTNEIKNSKIAIKTGAVASRAIFYYNLSGFDSVPYNGSTCDVDFSSTVTAAGTWTSVDGSSTATWHGYPVDADSISMTDSFTFSGVSISVTAPNSAGWSVSGNTAKYTNSVEDTWIMSHTFSNVTSYGVNVWITEHSSATFQFGSSFYTPNASDSHYL